MKAVILAGGLGTRLREETEFRPKPMVEVGGRPILWHIMKQLGSHGITDFVVAAGYRANMIKQYFLDYDARNNDFTIELGRQGSLRFHGDHEESDWTVTVADTGPETLTAGRVLRASRYLDDAPFLVTYGDGVADVDVTSLIRFHQSNGTLATVTTVQPTSRFGVLDTSEDGRVVSFREKPQLDGWINIGYFIFEQPVLRFLDETHPLETTPLARLADQGQLSAFRHGGFWQPMDTYRESQLLNQLWSSGSAPWKTWT
jgi:glucose-1-phosphate cytidylyltransferase